MSDLLPPAVPASARAAEYFPRASHAPGKSGLGSKPNKAWSSTSAFGPTPDFGHAELLIRNGPAADIAGASAGAVSRSMPWRIPVIAAHPDRRRGPPRLQV